jgi:hypothetical protein
VKVIIIEDLSVSATGGRRDAKIVVKIDYRLILDGADDRTYTCLANDYPL